MLYVVVVMTQDGFMLEYCFLRVANGVSVYVESEIAMIELCSYPKIK